MAERMKRRADGRYEARYTVQTATGPKRKTVYGRSQQEVRDKLAKAVADSRDGLVFDAGKLTVGGYMDRWLNDSVRGGVKRRTYESYLSITRRHIEPAIGCVKLAALTPAHVQVLYRAKQDDGLSAKTISNVHITLHRALAVAVKWQLIPRNVCDAVTVPKRRSPNIRPLTARQAKAFLEAVEGDRYEALYVLALTTGMRQGEILGLCWGDVDGRTVRVSRSLITGWGRQTYEAPKTAKGRRTITLTARAAARIAAHKESQRAASLYAEDAPVFTNRVGNPVHPKHLLDRSFKPLLAKAGLPPIRFHDLRHTAATLLLGQNVHPKVVQELLGHANISITLDTYTHLLPGWGDAAAGAMDDALGG